MVPAPDVTSDLAGLPAGLPTANRIARVLVVDDDALSRSLQAQLVSLLGHRAQIVDTPLHALDLALADDVDAMLLDLGMPELDGFALLGQLRVHEARRGRRPLPVIAVTGYAAPLDRLRCLAAGFTDHLSKPVDVAALGAALQRNLRPQCASAASDALRVQQAAERLAQAGPAVAGVGPTMLEAFALRSQRLVEDLQQAQQRHDRAALLRAADALRASAEFMGATGLADLCRRLHAEASCAHFATSGPLVAGLAAAHASVLGVLLLGSKGGAAR